MTDVYKQISATTLQVKSVNPGVMNFCRWDRVSLQRLLTKLMSAPTLLTPAPSTKGLSPLARALASMPDPEKEEKGVHPQHVRISLDSESKSILGELTQSISVSRCVFLLFAFNFRVCCWECVCRS